MVSSVSMDSQSFLFFVAQHQEDVILGLPAAWISRHRQGFLYCGTYLQLSQVIRRKLMYSKAPELVKFLAQEHLSLRKHSRVALYSLDDFHLESEASQRCHGDLFFKINTS